ncbi:unnamed protein product [Leptosia nina]|uniref:Uncharacterized protein n=1 Tax=Leptosia nina TaxID=320188 RepID=A0AAV1JAJ2_9NEOP
MFLFGATCIVLLQQALGQCLPLTPAFNLSPTPLELLPPLCPSSTAPSYADLSALTPILSSSISTSLATTLPALLESALPTVLASALAPLISSCNCLACGSVPTCQTLPAIPSPSCTCNSAPSLPLSASTCQACSVAPTCLTCASPAPAYSCNPSPVFEAPAPASVPCASAPTCASSYAVYNPPAPCATLSQAYSLYY